MQVHQKGGFEGGKCPVYICLIQGNRYWFRIETAQIWGFNFAICKAGTWNYIYLIPSIVYVRNQALAGCVAYLPQDIVVDVQTADC